MVNGGEASNPTGFSLQDYKITKYILLGLAGITLVTGMGAYFSGCFSSSKGPDKTASKLEQKLEFKKAKNIEFPTGKIPKKGFRLYDVLGGEEKNGKHVEGTGSRFTWNRTTNKFSVRVAKSYQAKDKIFTNRECTIYDDVHFIGYKADVKPGGSGLHGTVHKYWRLKDGSEVSKAMTPALNNAYQSNLEKANKFFAYAKKVYKENVKNRRARAIDAQRASAEKIKAPGSAKPKEERVVLDRDLSRARSDNTYEK